MEVRTLVASLHTATTAAGNGNSASNPTGGGLIAGTLTGSGYVTAVCVLEASVAGSVWVPLAEPVEFRGHGVVPVKHYYSATAPLVRLRVVSITGTLAVGVYRVEEGTDEPLTQTPSGTLVSTDPIVAPGYTISDGSIARHLQSTGLGIDLHGSSSIAQCHNPAGVIARTMKVLATSADADVGETWGGLMHGALNQGCPLQVEYNSGAGAETTVQIIDGMWTDLANPAYPNQHIKCTVLAPLANDIPDGTNPATLETVIDQAVNRLLRVEGREKVALWMPHTRNPMPGGVSHATYQTAQRMLRAIASRYGNRCRVFSAYDILNAGGVDTPSAYIVDVFAHLNTLGGKQLAPLWMELAAWLGWVAPNIETTEFGTPIMRVSGKGIGLLDGYTSYTSSATTIAAGTANEDGDARWLITGTGAIATVSRLWQRALLDASRPVVAGRNYRLYVHDLEVATSGTGTNILYQPGAAFHSVSPSAPRSRVGAFGGVTGLVVPVGARMRKRLGPIFTATPAMAATPELLLYSGDGGYAIQSAHVDLLEVP